MADSYRTFVEIEVPVGSRAPAIEGLEVGHFLDGPHDGMARFGVLFRDHDLEPLIVALGPVAASKLGGALMAASFDHRAALERWSSVD